MTEPFDSIGWFWAPEAPSDKRPGRLTFNAADSGDLSLSAGPGGYSSPLLSMNPGHTRLLGTVGGQAVTLDGCQEYHTALFTGAQKASVSQLIEGLHIADEAEMAFDSVTVDIRNLPTWVNASVVAEERAYMESGRLEHLTHRLTPQDADVHEAEGVTISLRHRWSVPTSSLTESTFTQSKDIQLRFEALTPLNTLMMSAGFLEDLVTLAVDKPSSAETALLGHPQLREEAEQQRTRRTEATLRRRARVTLGDSEIPPRHVLFTYEQMGGVDGIARWLDTAMDYRATIGSLLSQRYGIATYVENRLQNVVNAAETFHRTKFPNQTRPKSEYREFRKSLVACVPEEHRDWLNAQLAYGNEPRLRKRLIDLAEYAGPISTSLLGDTEAWAKEVTDLRNAITHDPQRQGGNLTAGRAHLLCESVYYITVCCLLRESGMDGAHVDAIAENPRIAWLPPALAATRPTR